MTQVIQHFIDIPHVQIYTKQNITQRMCYNTVTLPKPDETLLDGIPYGVPNYMKEHQLKVCSIDLDNMLYRHIKEMIYDHTTYFICANVVNDLVTKYDPIVRQNEKYYSTSNKNKDKRDGN